jgi:hypothetical protein
MQLEEGSTRWESVGRSFSFAFNFSSLHPTRILLGGAAVVVSLPTTTTTI